MKLNLNNYKKDITYDKSLDNYNENFIIEEYINKYDECNYDSVMKDEYNVSKFSELSSIGTSILNWYQFKDTDKVLEVGAKLGNLTNLLCNKCGFVTALEFSKKRGEAIAKRLNDTENLEIIIGNLNEIDLKDNEYDYVTLIGSFEYAQIFFPNSINPYLDLMLWAKSKLKANGKILLALDNSMGVQYLSGGKSDKYNNVFDGVLEDNYFTKYGLQKLFKEAELNNYKFYYPYPNYKIANVIFSDDYEITENSSKLLYNIVYNEDSIVVMDELKLFKKFVKNNMFKEVSNSYFIEIDMSGNRNDINFISYNNLRKDKYRLMLTMTNDYAEKNIILKQSEQHLAQYMQNIKELKSLNFNLLDDVKDNKIISKVCKELQFDEYLVNLAQKNKEEEFYSAINNWFNEIKEKLLIESNFIENKNGLNILKNVYIDLVFENTFIENEKYIFYDQEWKIENIPLEFILYRAINNLYIYNSSKLNIFIENVLEKFNLKQNIEIFKEIENIFQTEVIDAYLLRFFSRPYTFKRNISELEKIYRMKFELAINEDLKIKNAENVAIIEEYKLKLEEMKKTIEERLLELNNISNKKNELIDSKIQAIIDYIKSIK